MDFGGWGWGEFMEGFGVGWLFMGVRRIRVCGLGGEGVGGGWRVCKFRGRVGGCMGRWIRRRMWRKGEWMEDGELSEWVKGLKGNGEGM